MFRSLQEQAINALSDILNTDKQKLFEKLRALRLDLAKTKKVSPFTVFSDSILVEMSLIHPETIESIGRIPGVGSKKIQDNSEQFLKKSIIIIAEILNLSSITISQYLGNLVEYGFIKDVSKWITQEEIKLVESVIPETGVERLKPIYEKLKEKLCDDTIRIAVVYWIYNQK